MLRMVRGLLLPLLLLAGCDVVFGLEREPPPPPVPGEWSKVASGTTFSCAIQTDQTLWCWGDQTFGATGVGSAAPGEVLAPTQVGMEHWTAVTAGASHACGLHDDATLWCWGFNGFGSVGDDAHESRFEPVQIGEEHWYAVSAGDYSTCAIRDSDRSLWCWGSNTLGQLGDGTTGERASPMLTDSTHRWHIISVGGAHGCALTEDQGLYCWGEFPKEGVPSPLLRPESIEPGTQWTAIASGAATVCAIDLSGVVSCWGFANGLGQLGDGTQVVHERPAPIQSTRTDWVSIAARDQIVCAIAADGTLACWGENRHGQIGSDTAAPLQLVPHVLDGAWSAVAPGSRHACAIDADAHLWCTGSSALGQRGDGTGGSQLVPEKLDGTWTAIETGESTTCGLRSGKLWCWGDNASGQLGEGTTIARQVPVETGMTTPTPLLTVGQYDTCDASSSGDLYCWGDNQSGELGPLVTLPSVSSPMKVSTMPTTLGAITASHHTCAIGVNGTPALCWGSNSAGQLGRGGVAGGSSNQYVPVYSNFGSQLQFKTISAGFEHTCGTTLGDDQVYCWGRGTEGQLGLDAMVSTTAAYATGLFPVASISAGTYHTCAITMAKQLVCWGANLFGQLGDGTTTPHPKPIAIGSDTWIAVSAGSAHTCAIRDPDRTLWCWGSNARGAVGDGTQVSRMSPVQIGSAAWLSVSAGNEYTCGVQMNGTGWCWGVRLWGALGDNLAWTNRYAPVVMP